MPVQLRMFTSRPLRVTYLLAPESPRRATYCLWIEQAGSEYRVCKESGSGGVPLHRQFWICPTMEDALIRFDKIIGEKTRPDRNSVRKYKIFCSCE